MKYYELETPSLLIDIDRVKKNLRDMQDYADEHGCSLRPHTKTHKSPYMAKLAEEMGARGCAVAKTGEAEVMAANGMKDIFIANEIVSPEKLQKIRKLSETAEISFGLDSPEAVPVIDEVFKGAAKKAQVLIEIEIGEVRSGIIEPVQLNVLLDALKKSENIYLKGFFGHDGNTYSAPSVEACTEIAVKAQERLLSFVNMARARGFESPVVSYGATPTFMNRVPILPGITELRPGTYIYMDVSQGNAIGTLERCAATVLTSVVSKPNGERVILDVGAKGLTMQERTEGICASHGKGSWYDDPRVRISRMFDEHAIVNDASFNSRVKLGEKIRIIPVHICPVVNLYNSFYLISGDEVLEEVPVLCRGQLW